MITGRLTPPPPEDGVWLEGALRYERLDGVLAVLAVLAMLAMLAVLAVLAVLTVLTVLRKHQR